MWMFCFCPEQKIDDSMDLFSQNKLSFFEGEFFSKVIWGEGGLQVSFMTMVEIYRCLMRILIATYPWEIMLA